MQIDDPEQVSKILIAPKEPLEISRVCHDPDLMQRVYDIGRRKAEAIVNDHHLH